MKNKNIKKQIIIIKTMKPIMNICNNKHEKQQNKQHAYKIKYVLKHKHNTQ